MSLKSELQKLIRERGYMSIDDIEAYCKRNNYKLSNAERRLRSSESPMIEAVRKDNYIIGYRPKRYNETIVAQINAVTPREIKVEHPTLFS